MASDYLDEIRRIQPSGPYLLGGFSGGGLIAYEMARQLENADQHVAALILLDTPIRHEPRFNVINKVEMWLPGLKAEGLRFLKRKLRERKEWRRELVARDDERRTEGSNSAQFHSRRVGDAFIRALAHYVVRKAKAKATLFRQKLKVKFHLRDGRMIDAARNVLVPDNGWTPHVSELAVIEVPGNHDSMVLEPNVRVLAASLRRVLAEADD
jgi:thioesterase domain-containing protein